MRENIKRSINAYVSDGVPLGDFLTAVMEHDLFEAFARADEENARDLREIVGYIYCEAPALCHGSREDVQAWLDMHADARRDAAAEAGVTPSERASLGVGGSEA